MMDETFFDHMDQLIRIGAAQIRTLKVNQCDWLRVAKKSSKEEKEAIQEILQVVCVEPRSKMKPFLKLFHASNVFVFYCVSVYSFI